MQAAVPNYRGWVDKTPSPALHPVCENCGTALHGRYCSACGQKDVDLSRSFRHVLHEAIEAWFHVDHSFLHGFYDLLFRPGLMTIDFNAGRRARHVPPFRFYLVVSLLFFFVAFRHEPAGVDEQGVAVTLKTTGATPDSEVTLDDIQLDLPFSPERTLAIRRSILEKVRHPERTLSDFSHALTKALLVCLPVLALLTRVAYWRRPYLYLQHLVLSVHLHTFLFLWWVVALGWAAIADLVSPVLGTGLSVAAAGYAVVYYFLALKRVFATSTVRALTLGTLVGGAYALFATIVVVATLIITLAFL